MKYDRPVWQIMHQCADAMPDVFRYEHVRNWFSDHFPDVNEATIRAHLIGLTEGGRAKHVQFAQRSPVFRRVARGEYEPIPIPEWGENPDEPLQSASRIKMSGNGDHRVPADTVPSDTVPADTVQPGTAGHDQPTSTDSAARKSPGKGDESVPQAPAKSPQPSPEPEPARASHELPDAAHHIPDVILLGSVGDRVNVPAPAKEVYREVSFQLSRLDAELAGSEWFVLSAEHGLVAPNEWMSPDSRTLADMDPDYRVVWATWVVTRLQSLVGTLDGMFVRVDAPSAFTGPLFADLQEAGAVVSSGSFGTATRPRVTATVEVVEPVEVGETVEPAGQNPPVAVEPVEDASPVAVHLADPCHAVPAADVSSLPESPGLYGWLVDVPGARDLNRSLQLPVRAGLIFVGQVGGSNWHALADPVLNLRDHVDRIQLHGRARASTFRMTLATVLREHLRMTTLEDQQLTEWMLQHLSVAAWPSDDFSDLRELEQMVISELDPPLNVDHLPATEYRARLRQMRSALA